MERYVGDGIVQRGGTSNAIAVELGLAVPGGTGGGGEVGDITAYGKQRTAYGKTGSTGRVGVWVVGGNPIYYQCVGWGTVGSDAEQTITDRADAYSDGYDHCVGSPKENWVGRTNIGDGGAWNV